MERPRRACLHLRRNSFRDTIDQHSTVKTQDIAPPLPAQSPPISKDSVLLSATVLTAALLRFHALAVKPFWFDEGVSVAIARLDGYNFARLLWRREANISLYYLLLRPWLHFGNSEAFIRGLSVVFALATLPALYLLGRRLFNPRVGLIAAALLAVNAYHIRYSQEARTYTLMIFLCVLSSLYFLKCLEKPSRGNRLAYILVSVLAVYAHFFAGLLLAAQWLSLHFLQRDGTAPSPKPIPKKDWLWIALLILPIAAFVVSTGAGPLRWVQRPGPKELWELTVRMAGNGGLPLVIAYAVAAVAALLPLKAVFAPHRLPWDAWRYRFLLLWLFFPPLFIFLVSMARPLFLPRYFIFCLPALILIAAAGISRLRSPWLLTPALIVFFALALRGTASYYRRDFDLQRDDWRATTRFLLDHARPGDALVFHIAMGRMPFEYYHSLFGATYSDPVVLYPNHAVRLTFLDFVEKPDYAHLARSFPQYQRVWLVLSDAGTPSNLDPTASALAGTLHSSFPRMEQQDLPSAEVLLFSK
jgi:uncharacterized membrane protein